MTRLENMLSIATVACLGLAAAGASHAQTVAIVNGEVHTVTGGVIEDGDVIIRDGRIVRVGPSLDVPEDATVHDAGGKIVTPGLFVANTEFGDLDGISYEYVGANFDIVDAFEPATDAIAQARSRGLTGAGVMPSYYGGLFNGTGAVIKLSGNVAPFLEEQGAQVANFETDWQNVVDAIEQVRRYAGNPERYRSTLQAGELKPREAKALLPVLSGDTPLIAYADSANQIRRAARLKADHGIELIILGGAEGWVVADELAALNIPVILDATANTPYDFGAVRSTLRNAERLHAAGVSISFIPGSGGESTIRQAAGNAVANGLPYAAGLAAITLNPARMLGVESEVGSIEVGKAGDVVVWQGDPLDVTSWPEHVFIDGKEQPLGSRQDMLYERYKDLSRGSLPHVYRGK